MLTAFDLFSGVGASASSMRDVFRTTLYCEKDKYCHKVLNHNIKQGRLDDAPLIDDVVKVTRESTEALGVSAPDLIMGSSPCTDVSVCGRREGISKPRSGLIREMFRLASEVQPKLMFFENAANMNKVALKEVLDEMSSRGYVLYWAVVSALDVGAPHVRKRWWCLAVRRDVHPFRVEVPCTASETLWSPPYPPSKKMLVDKPANYHARCRSLGNAVVPAAARAAFKHLIDNQGMVLSSVSKDIPKLPTNGFYDGVTLGTIAAYTPTCSTDHPPLIIHAPTPGAVKHEKNTLQPLTGIVERKHIATPMYSVGTLLVVKTLTRRSLANIGTQIYYSHDNDRSTSGTYVNVQYLEWLMGLPEDWTKLPETS